MYVSSVAESLSSEQENNMTKNIAILARVYNDLPLDYTKEKK